MSINTNMKWDLSRSADQASKVISSLTIQLNGSSQGSYNGSAARTVNITPSSIGAAASNHTHNYAGSSSAGGSANSVKSSLVIKLNGGSNEGTNMFTYNGSSPKTVNITASNIGAADSNHTHDDYFQYRGILTSESSFDTATKPGWYYVNGATLSMTGGQWWGKLRITYNNDGTLQQELINGKSFFIRDKSGSPATWSPWKRIDSPVQTISRDFGNITIKSGSAYIGSTTTINYSGLWIISGCTYAVPDFEDYSNKYGCLQACAYINGQSWLMGNQSLNEGIGRPGVGGSIIMPLNKGDTLTLRIYYGSSGAKDIVTWCNRLYAACLSQT